MASDKSHKGGAANALNKYLENDWLDQQKTMGLIKKRKNMAPEKAVQNACLAWMRENEWVVEIYESKATQVNGVWRNQAMKAGHADCAGVMPDGIACAVEFKAPGKLSSFNRGGNERQKDFIIKRIHSGSFACVVDSVERLLLIYDKWSEVKAVNPQEAKHYLLSQLP